jgi:hypothetical protein
MRFIVKEKNMAVMLSKDEKELVVTCGCGCDNAFHIVIQKSDDDYAFMSYLNGKFYEEQNHTLLRIVGGKIKRIWAIIRNKDFYYSDIVMSREDFETFKEYINKL